MPEHADSDHAPRLPRLAFDLSAWSVFDVLLP